MGNVKGVQQYIGQLATPLVVVITVAAIYYFFSKSLKVWQFRNLGTSKGVDDFSNLSYEIYNTFEGWFASPDDLNDISARLLAFSDDELLRLNDVFVKLFGDKCNGGGVFCSDTTSLYTFVKDRSCFPTGCKNLTRLTERLQVLLT